MMLASVPVLISLWSGTETAVVEPQQTGSLPNRDLDASDEDVRVQPARHFGRIR
jgi:hypothetical protein